MRRYLFAYKTFSYTTISTSLIEEKIERLSLFAFNIMFLSILKVFDIYKKLN